VRGAASRNNVLSLFFEIVLNPAPNMEPEHDIFLGRPDRVKAYRERRVHLIEAILDDDPSVAELLVHRTSELVQPWRDEEVAHLAPPPDTPQLTTGASN
jgi:hypothetical protein